MDYINRHYRLSQKEIITLGVVATEKKILSTQLSAKLQLNQEDKLKSWLGSLLEKKIIITRGVKKGTEYLLNPEVFSLAKLDLNPSLRTIEPFKLKALILEYLRYNGFCKLSKIQDGLKEAIPEDIQKAVYKLVEEGELETSGAKRNRTYGVKKE